MREKYQMGLALGALFLPLGCWVGKMPFWATGLILGEGLGWLSYFWVGFTVRRGLAKVQDKINRTFILHSLARYLFIIFVLGLAVKLQCFNLVGVLIGYMIIQLPAAVMRALPAKDKAL